MLNVVIDLLISNFDLTYDRQDIDRLQVVNGYFSILQTHGHIAFGL